jgi:hypothetical protein
LLHPLSSSSLALARGRALLPAHAAAAEPHGGERAAAAGLAPRAYSSFTPE